MLYNLLVLNELQGVFCIVKIYCFRSRKMKSRVRDSSGISRFRKTRLFLAVVFIIGNITDSPTRRDTPQKKAVSAYSAEQGQNGFPILIASR